MEYNFQNIIARFTMQSFGVKGLSLTFLALVYSSYLEYFSNKNAALLIICIMMLMLLDAYYLKMERIYRNIEDKCLENEKNFKGYNYKKYNIEKINVTYIVFSRTIVPVYLVQVIIVLAPVIELNLRGIL